MRRNISTCAFLLMACTVFCQPQTRADALPKDASAETILIHLNSTFFLTGENLLFSIYCVNPAGKRSDLSLLAYVELIGEDQKPLKQMKVRLENGVGNGDLFFDGRTPSGNYTLLVYTKWMRNFDASNFSRTTITVINTQLPPSVSKVDIDRSVSAGTQPVTDLPALTLHISKDKFDQREKVVIQIDNELQDSIVLSANVRMVEDVDKTVVAASPKINATAKQIMYLPDVRAELITGTIINRATRKPAGGQIVTLSAPATRFQFLTSRTDSTGRFYFNARNIKSQQILLNIYNGHPDDVVIETENCFLGDYAKLAPPKLTVGKPMKELINKRYVSTQIENAFYSMKKDSIGSSGPDQPFFNPDNVYELDQFTRFPTMEDVFREIIPEVIVRVRDGQFSLVIVNAVTAYKFTSSPLVLVDGVPVSDANEVMKYDPALIKTISLSTRHYYYGPIETDGIISIQTFEGTAKNIGLSRMTKVKYVQPQLSHIYYSPNYENQDLARIPDYRIQLYWAPLIRSRPTSNQTISFFTGDLAGKYFIEIVGVTSKGESVYLRKEFEVE
jgi:hypothetical protein